MVIHPANGLGNAKKKKRKKENQHTNQTKLIKVPVKQIVVMLLTRPAADYYNNNNNNHLLCQLCAFPPGRVGAWLLRNQQRQLAIDGDEVESMSESTFHFKSKQDIHICCFL